MGVFGIVCSKTTCTKGQNSGVKRAGKGRRPSATPLPLSMPHIHSFVFYSTTKHEIIQIKKIPIYYVVWTRLTRIGCFNWLAHYKRMRIADKNNVQIVHFKHKNDDKSI